MFEFMGRMAVRWRWPILIGALVLLGVAGGWGTTVFTELSSGGFDDPKGEAQRAAVRIENELGPQSPDLIILYSDENRTVDDPGFRGPVESVVNRLGDRPEVVRVISYYETQAPQLVSSDRKATYLAVNLAGKGDDEKIESYDEIRDLVKAEGLTTQVGGPLGVFDDLNSQVAKDVAIAETVSLPILLILLIFIFRSAVAALLPLAVGTMAIMGAFLATRLIVYATDVSIFAINVITLLGLGLGIDYALLVVNRFREELRDGWEVPDAIRRTVATAGRTVTVSGLTLCLALSGLVLFPQQFLRSMGYGAIATVLVAVASAVTVLPALLALLGHRVNRWRVPLPGARRRQAVVADDSEGVFARLGRSVMRRPVLYIVGSLVLLAVIALPVTHVRFGSADERVLPASAASREVADRISADFADPGTDHLRVLVSGGGVEAANTVAAGIRGLPHVTEARVAAERGGSALVEVVYDVEPSSREARQLVADIRALPEPGGSEVLVTGRPAALVDRLDSLGSRLPWMALAVVGVMLVILFVSFRSVVLPFKAVVMNAISIAAALGAIVWVFQDGHLSGVLGFTPTNELEANQLLLIATLLFGLSLDYEVFLLARIREEWERTGDTRHAIAAGLQRSGGIITSAAVLLIIVFAGFTFAGVTFMKMIGLGTVVAIALDATVVRLLLVPATMRLLGRANWWGPWGRIPELCRDETPPIPVSPAAAPREDRVVLR
jgi:Predicted drug exporters of the RND superfamily